MQRHAQGAGTEPSLPKATKHPVVCVFECTGMPHYTHTQIHMVTLIQAQYGLRLYTHLPFEHITKQLVVV